MKILEVEINTSLWKSSWWIHDKFHLRSTGCKIKLTDTSACINSFFWGIALYGRWNLRLKTKNFKRCDFMARINLPKPKNSFNSLIILLDTLWVPRLLSLSVWKFTTSPKKGFTMLTRYILVACTHSIEYKSKKCPTLMHQSRYTHFNRKGWNNQNANRNRFITTNMFTCDIVE